VIAFNKWDLVDADRRIYLDKEIDRELKRIPWAVRVNISAKTGRAVDKSWRRPYVARSASWETRNPTAPVPVAHRVTQATLPRCAGARAPRVLFATQAGVAPPRFRALHDRAVDPGYLRVRRAQASSRSSASRDRRSSFRVRPREDVGPGRRLILVVLVGC
jgi:GTP-binding protein